MKIILHAIFFSVLSMAIFWAWLIQQRIEAPFYLAVLFAIPAIAGAVVGLMIAFASKYRRWLGAGLAAVYLIAGVAWVGEDYITKRIIPGCRAKVERAYDRRPNTKILTAWCVDQRLLEGLIRKAENKNHRESFDWILTQGVSHPNPDCARLGISVANYDLEETTRLLDKGVSPICSSYNNRVTPLSKLFYALKPDPQREPKMLAKLRDAGAQITQDHLLIAIRTGNYYLLSEALKSIDPNFGFDHLSNSKHASQIRNPLALAIRTHDFKAFQMLIEAGADTSRKVALSIKKGRTIDRYSLYAYAMERKQFIDYNVKKNPSQIRYLDWQQNINAIVALFKPGADGFSPLLQTEAQLKDQVSKRSETNPLLRKVLDKVLKEIDIKGRTGTTVTKIKDPWGNNIRITTNKSRRYRNKVSIDVYSIGPDGIDETSDDIHHKKTEIKYSKQLAKNIYIIDAKKHEAHADNGMNDARFICASPTSNQAHTLIVLARKVGEKYSSDKCDILYQKLEQLTRLNLYRTGIQDISPLSSLLGLTDLNLAANRISNIESLKGMTQLTNLSLEVNRVSKIDELSGLTNLTELRLRVNKVEDISPLKNLKKIATLDLSHNNISDLAPLKELTQLTKLYLNSSGLTSLGSLKEIEQLEVLSLEKNNIADISAIKKLKKLTELNLVSTAVSDLTPLKALTHLDKLMIGGRDSNISDISVLEELGQLTELSINRTKVSDFAPLRKLKKLKKLSLHETLISDRSVFQGMDQLTYLDLSGTDLASIAVGYLRSDSSRDEVLEIYRQPAGGVIGKVTFKPHFHDAYLNPSAQILINVNGENIVNFHRDKVGSGWLYDNDYFLLYYGEQDGFVRILASTLKEPVFIKIQSDNTIKTITWIQDLVGRGGGSYIYGYGGHDLKDNPSNVCVNLTPSSQADQSVA